MRWNAAKSSSGSPAWRILTRGAMVAALAFASLASAAEIRIGGTGNALGTMQRLAEAYAKAQPDTKVAILTSIGTSGAIKAVPKRAIEIGLSSRTLTDEETRSGMSTIEYARSPTVFAVHEKTRADGLTLRSIADIYTGKMANWADGTSIRPLLRQPGDDNTRQVKSLSPEIENALTLAEKKPGMAFAVSDQEAAEKLETIHGAFGVTTLALIRSERRSLRALAIDGVEATPENAKSGRYPLTKHFYFVLPKEPTPAALDFIRFVESDKGKEILRQSGHYLP